MEAIWNDHLIDRQSAVNRIASQFPPNHLLRVITFFYNQWKTISGWEEKYIHLLETHETLRSWVKSDTYEKITTVQTPKNPLKISLFPFFFFLVCKSKKKTFTVHIMSFVFLLSFPSVSGGHRTVSYFHCRQVKNYFFCSLSEYPIWRDMNRKI